jgi:hypothetical protein
LQFALQYRKAIEAMVGDLSNGLRKYEMDDEEWGLIEELTTVLKVCNRSFPLGTPVLT